MTTQKAAPPDDPILKTLVDRIVAVFQPEAVWLFGSRARGDARADSDYDFLVVVPDDTPPDRRSWRRTNLVEREPGVGLDILPVRRSTFHRERGMVGTTGYKAVHEGRVVYEH